MLAGLLWQFPRSYIPLPELQCGILFRRNWDGVLHALFCRHSLPRLWRKLELYVRPLQQRECVARRRELMCRNVWCGVLLFVRGDVLSVPCRHRLVHPQCCLYQLVRALPAGLRVEHGRIHVLPMRLGQLCALEQLFLV